MTIKKPIWARRWIGQNRQIPIKQLSLVLLICSLNPYVFTESLSEIS